MAEERNEVVEFCQPGGPQVGDIAYFDGTEWICLPAGVDGQILVMGSGGIPEWQNTP